jgi:hypothetical protein
MCLSSCPSGPPTADNRAPSPAPPAPPHVRQQTHLNDMQTCRMPRGFLSTFHLKLTRSMWACITGSAPYVGASNNAPYGTFPPQPTPGASPSRPPTRPEWLDHDCTSPHTTTIESHASPAGPIRQPGYQDTLRSVPGSTHLARRSLISCLSLTLSPFSCSSANKQRVSVSAPPRPTWLTHDPKPPGASPSKVRDTCTGHACAEQCL